MSENFCGDCNHELHKIGYGACVCTCHKGKLKKKDWLQVFYNNELYIIHKEHKKELENFLSSHRTVVGYLDNHYTNREDLVK